jgi:alpha-mannosidase
MKDEADLPALFRWQSPDGSTVSTFRIQMNYCDHHWGYDPEGQDKGFSLYGAKLNRTRKLTEADTIPYLHFYGVGNHGGGPTEECLKELSAATAAEPDIVFSSAKQFFEDTKDLMLPLITTDLQHHASGCYSASSRIKKSNRRTENRLISAEKYDVLAVQATKCPSKNDLIKNAYEKLLFNQFHDILPGCAIEEALEEALRYNNAAWANGEDVAEYALQRLSWNIDTAKGIKSAPDGKENWLIWESRGEGAPVVVFNPHSFPIKHFIQINHSQVIGITDENGIGQPIQHVRGPQSNGTDIHNTMFAAEVPAYGYRTYYIYTQKEFEYTPCSELSVTETCLENDYIKVEFDREKGTISNFYDKKRDIQLISGGGALPILIEDSASDTWAHMVFKFDDQIGRFTDVMLEVVDKGPLLATIRIKSNYNRSTLVQDFSLSYFSNELTVKCKLDFAEKHKIVKLCFPLAMDCQEITYEMPFGYISKPCDGLEEVAHRYVSMSGVSSDGRKASLALLNDCKYSFSAKENEMRMIAVRSCGFADHFWYRNQPIEYMDMGKQSFTYILMPHDNDIAKVTKSAMLLNQPPEHIMETNHDGALSRTFTGIDICADNIVCQAIKFAEAKEALVLRLYETAGLRTKTEITLNLPNYETSFKLDFGKHEVKTILIDKDLSIKETNLTEL